MYIPFKSFVLRTPLLPTKNAMEKLADMLSLVCTPQIQEAIFVASPAFYNELYKYLDQGIEITLKNKRIISSVVRYVQRMATRSTPFGLFAGCSVGHIGEETCIKHSGSIQRTTRLDMMYLCNLSQHLSSDTEIKNRIKFYPNSSIYEFNSTYRYIEYQYKNDQRSHQINSVVKDSILKNILTFCVDGKTTAEIKNRLIDSGFIKEEIDPYLDALISSQLLMSELEPTVTGDDYLDKIISILEGLNLEENNIINTLIDIRKNIDRLDQNKINHISCYLDTKKIVDKIGVAYNEKHLFQVDMGRCFNENTLSTKIVEKLQKTINFFNKITPKNDNQNLKIFQEAFYRRYEDKEVPLSLVLDPEIGIGYPIDESPSDNSDLLNDFEIYKNTDENNLSSSSMQKILLKKSTEAFSKGLIEIELEDSDFSEVISSNELSSTFYVLFQLTQTVNDELIYIKSCGGTSGANLISRFSHTDEEMNSLLREITQKEEELLGNAIVAEIAHLPDSHVGNILYRKHLHSYEITYLAHNDLSSSMQIPISDIRISIKNGKLYLRSVNLNKRIIPRLTSAHNFTMSSIPMYRFLCDIQDTDNQISLYIDWGILEQLLDFFPRVTYSGVVLSYAAWHIRKKEIISFLDAPDDATLISEASKWRKLRNLPQQVVFSDGDNELFIDFNNSASIGAFLAVVKQREVFRLKEFIFSQKNNIVSDHKGNCYANEFLLTFYKGNL